MKTSSDARRGIIVLAAFLTLALVLPLSAQPADEPVDMQKARDLMQKQRAGQTLTAEEQQYLDRARAQYQPSADRQEGAATAPARQREAGSQPASQPASRPQLTPKPTTGMVPLTELATNLYKGEDGGLYGGGKNEPPPEHAALAKAALAKIQPLDADGKPSPDGKIVLMSIGMSNTTQEFQVFKKLADADPRKSAKLVVVDGAMGGMDVTAWALNVSKRGGPTPWQNAFARLKEAGVTPKQVQVIWLKQAKINPGGVGGFPKHARALADEIIQIINMANGEFANLHAVYLSSRIYAGYATGGLNPEPYAYESAFANRWVIQDQIKGESKLNTDPAKGPVLAPVVLWGPYLWADGTTPRKADGLVYIRQDLAADGTHPSDTSGREKVAKQLLDFFTTNEGAKSWFMGK